MKKPALKPSRDKIFVITNYNGIGEQDNPAIYVITKRNFSVKRILSDWAFQLDVVLGEFKDLRNYAQAAYTKDGHTCSVTITKFKKPLVFSIE